MSQGILYVVSAPSGAGKTSLLAAALAADPQLCLSVSHTTRAPRPGEQDGVHYHFVDQELFAAMDGRGDFIECAEVYGNRYGTSAPALRELLERGRDVILEIDWQGARQIRSVFPSVITLFVMPPSVAELERRLTRRAQDDDATVARRMAAAREDLAHAREFDYVIINEDFDEATADLLAIFRAERLRRPRQEEARPGMFHTD